MFRNTVKVLSATALLAAVALASTDAFAHGGGGGRSGMSGGPVKSHPVLGIKLPVRGIKPPVRGIKPPHPPGIKPPVANPTVYKGPVGIKFPTKGTGANPTVYKGPVVPIGPRPLNNPIQNYPCPPCTGGPGVPLGFGPAGQPL